MGNENGEWIMHGLGWDNPRRLHTWRELIERVNEIGFLPLFKNSLPGFSVEEMVSPLFWWTGDPTQDPWEWREIIARTGEVAYGKFFGKKAGFVSREWFPHFANYRRDGYDFDTLWDEELTSRRCKKIMDNFTEGDMLPSNLLKRLAGFGKEGERNFDGTVTELQMKSYLLIRDFRRRRNKMGLEFGMPVSVFTTPEALWGYEHISSAYSLDPAESLGLIIAQLRLHFPNLSSDEIKTLI